MHKELHDRLLQLLRYPIKELSTAVSMQHRLQDLPCDGKNYDIPHTGMTMADKKGNSICIVK